MLSDRIKENKFYKYPYYFVYKDTKECKYTVGAKEDIPALADKPRDLKEGDDKALIHSRTSNSVVLRFVSPEPLTAPMMQARLRVTVKTEEEDLPELSFCTLINVPLSACAP